MLFAVRGRLVLEDGVVPGAVVVRDGAIDAVLRHPAASELPATVLQADIVAPGFIDLQINGGFGAEVGDSAEAIRRLAASLPSVGVTAFLPTLVSSPPPVYPRAIDAMVEARDCAGARPLGLHLEGPFLSLRRAGAHRRDAIEGAPADLFDRLPDRDAVRAVTMAPELPGATERIRRLTARGVVVSLGHTEASHEQFTAGVDAGATMATHLYNAMSGFAPRAPGAMGAALVDDRVTAGLIADGVHSHPAAVRLAVRAKGPARIVLVSDAIAGAGMPPGVYELGGVDVTVDGTQARLRDGTLAGSVLTLDQAVRNVVAWTGCGVADACRMASETPARVLGLGAKGRLAPGCDADLVLLDDDLRVLATLRDGREVYRRPGN
jgi:N-acetylglucosamine-6-phosphate deacetylase